MKVFILIAGHTPTPSAWRSQLAIVAGLIKHGYDVEVRINSDPGIHHGRNMLLLGGRPMVSGAVPIGEPYDAMLWMDSDIVAGWEDAEKLLEAEPDIVSGLYGMNPQNPDAAVAGLETPGAISFGTRIRKSAAIEGQGLLEVDFVGFGFLMVRRGVFEELVFPWFDTLYEWNGDIAVNVAEDFGWCHKIRGRRQIYVHRNVVVGHEKLTVV